MSDYIKLKKKNYEQLRRRKEHKKRLLNLFNIFLVSLVVLALINIYFYINNADYNTYIFYNSLAIVIIGLIYLLYKKYYENLDSLATSIVLLAFCIPFGIILFRKYLVGENSWEIDELGPVGDFIAGSTVSFLTLASILLILETLKTQRFEMSENRLEFEEQTIQMELQNYKNELYSIYNNKINYIQNLNITISDNLASQLKQSSFTYITINKNEIKGSDVLEFIHYVYSNQIDVKDHKNEIIKIYYKSFPFLFNQNIILFEVIESYNNINFKEESSFYNIKELKNLVLNMDFYERKIMQSIAQQAEIQIPTQELKEKVMQLQQVNKNFQIILNNGFRNYPSYHQIKTEKNIKAFEKMEQIEKKISKEIYSINGVIELNKLVRNPFYTEYREYTTYTKHLEKLQKHLEKIKVKLDIEEINKMIYSAIEIELFKEKLLKLIDEIEKNSNLKLEYIRNSISDIPEYYSSTLQEYYFSSDIIYKIINNILTEVDNFVHKFTYNFLSDEISNIITLMPKQFISTLKYYDYFGKD